MNKNDIRVGLNSPSFSKNPLRWWRAWKYRKDHKRLHNKNTLFYPTQPSLLEGIVRAVNIQIKKKKLAGYGYYEFGVFKGFSLWFAQMYIRCRNFKNIQFYGFDSFEGLPKSKVDSMKPAFGKGHYAAPYDSVVNKLKELDSKKIKLFKGFYSEELFAKLKKENKFLPVSICVIDVDVYESCVEVLEFIKDYLVPGSIVLFDDYNVFLKSDEHSERKALREFKKANPNFKMKHLFGFGWGGMAFEVIDK